MSKLALGFLLHVCIFNAAELTSAQEKNELGITVSQPTSGYYVAYQDVYLIPYSFLIPGTKTSIEMVPVPAGKFNLSLQTQTGEHKSVEVNVAPFWIAKTETTWKQYGPFLDLGSVFRQFEKLKIRQIDPDNKIDGVTAPSLIYDEDYRRHHYGGTPNHPVGTVSQFGAKAYTKFLTKLTSTPYRLPSLVEWQYAANANRRTTSPPAEAINKIAWTRKNTRTRKEVATKPPNPWGIYDMQGNVSEWVLDGQKCLSSTLINRGSIDSLSSVAWPTEHRKRLALGGSFLDLPKNCQVHSQKSSSARLYEDEPMLPHSPHWTTSTAGQGIGFRIVRPVDRNVPLELANRYWEPDHPKITNALKVKQESGYATRGLVNPELPTAAKNFIQQKQLP
ncbi:formylglycine-generating enzyme family protein [bacterium]|nr:formylglycine-generating enzyme family protein [Mariniblastus sp.]MDA7870494.1 formylglycine-generating enzyme family protein [bacterium]MDA7880576.1 formylglycine-generating enzyme family protein [Mariniblastus sp.]MDA7887699.1 formylglycine-generating enzyme family protein [bacterium]MDA7909092.1 formylglycine-generating enzyme family protein [bacterium]